ncbi:gp075 [Rhodococcus phage ReqiPoco6]|uniref:Gp075 n=1 Tax=Rhodococcus phage ReqiPoco6 TaxID=691964 RepID=D4P7U3_9CAUD|nr:gp075 [Rhodococcus phage ReqiPoco6]ADD81073.1 gp075 [Rhodococcus phage ReqiPoco6]
MTEMKNDTPAMTADVLHAYLRDIADRHEIEDKPILVNGRKVVEVGLHTETVRGDFGHSDRKYVEVITNEKRNPIDASMVDEFLETFNDEIADLPVIVDGFPLYKTAVEDGCVVLHQLPHPPKPMTAEILKGYLDSIIKQDPAVETELVLIGSPSHINDARPINDYGLRNGIIYLGHSETPTRETLRTIDLRQYLSMTSGGLFRPVYERPVMIGDQEVVNVTVVDNRVILMTFNDMLKSEDFFRR